MTTLNYVKPTTFKLNLKFILLTLTLTC